MNKLPPKLSPWVFALFTLTQCARSETVDERVPPPKVVAAASVKAPRTKDDVADPAVRISIEGLPAFGDAKALLTVVTFTDYECPYCAKADTRIESLREEYGDKLRLVVASQPLPVHEHAAAAARAFLAAVEQNKGEAMHKKLFAMNRASTTMNDEGLRDAAHDIGLDVAAFDRARNDTRTADALAIAENLAGKLGVQGTPTFFVNGRRLVGARPIEAFRSLFDEELTKAAQLGGTDTYAKLMKGLPEAPPVKAGIPEPDEAFAVDLARAPTRGATEGPVTIVFFSDFECPYCVKAEKTLRQLEAQKPGQIKIAYKFRPLPMHAHARLAAKAALAAERQSKFWEYHDVLLAHHDALEREDLVKYATDLGLNSGRFERDMDDPSIEERINADEKQAEALGAKGTPTAFVNGHRMVGAQPLSQWVGLAERYATAR